MKRLLLISILFISVLFLLGAERVGKTGHVIRSGITYADTLIAGANTSLIYDMNLLENYVQFTIKGRTAGRTDSVKVYVGTIRYKQNFTSATDTLWSNAVSVKKLSVWDSTFTVATASNTSTSYFVVVPIIHLIKFSLSNTVYSASAKTDLIIEAK